MAGESATSPRRIEAADKQRRAVELRRAGASFRQIADELGYASVSSAYKAVMVALRKTLREPTDELRTLELERLDALTLVLWPKALQANLAAIDRLLRVMERRAKLSDLDAPTKIAPTTPDGTMPWQQVIVYIPDNGRDSPKSAAAAAAAPDVTAVEAVEAAEAEVEAADDGAE